MGKHPVKAHMKKPCAKNLVAYKEVEDLTTHHHYTEREASESNKPHHVQLNTENVSTALNKNSSNPEKKYNQSLITETYLSIVVQITEEINNFINKNRAASTELQRLLEARTTYNHKL